MLKTFRQASVPHGPFCMSELLNQVVSLFQVSMLWSKKSNPAGYHDSTLTYLVIQP